MGDEDEPFLPPDSPLIPIIILLVIGLIIGFILAVRNCCTRQLLSHHVQKKIARGGTLSKNPSFISTHNHINNNKNKEKEPFIKQPQDYGSIAATRLFEDLYAALSRRKEKSGKPSKLPKAKKISILHNTLCTKVTQIEQTLPLHIRTHSTFPILSLIIQDYVVFVRTSLIPVTTKFIVFCNEITAIQNALSNAFLITSPPTLITPITSTITPTPTSIITTPPVASSPSLSPSSSLMMENGQWQYLGSMVDEKVQWMAKFAEEVLRNSGELQVMAHKMFRIINAMYEEMRMSSATQNLASEASKTEYVFHLLSIYDSFKKMSIILQFARDEIDSTTFHLTQIQHLLDNSNFEQLEQTRLFLGEVVQILAADAAEQQQAAMAATQQQQQPFRKQQE